MLKNIDVRFFFVEYDYDEYLDMNEIDHQEFVERYADNPHARIDVEYHSVYANGVRQLCIILNEV